jgi:hypothetical protein
MIMRTAVPDIFDEVEEDLRAEQMRRLLRRYGGLAVAAVLLVVAGVAGWQAWTWYDGRRAAGVAERYAAALKAAEGRPGPGRQAAVPLFAAIAGDDMPAGYRTLARLQQAALLAQAGDLAGAGALWDQVSRDSDADRLLRDLAGLQWAEHHLDTGDPAELTARLAPVAAADNPFHGLAQEAQALLELRQGRTGAARDTLKLLTHDTMAPEGVRQRAESLLSQLGAAAEPTAKGSGS